MLKPNIEEKLSEVTLELYDKNSNYIEKCVDNIYVHFNTNGHAWGPNREPITRDMIEETIVDLIDTIVESDEKIDCTEAGTGGIIVKLEFDESEEDPDLSFCELTILLEL